MKIKRSATLNKAMKLQAISLFEILTFFISTFAFAFIIASATTPIAVAQATTTPTTPQVTTCCEKTLAGAFCQNTNSANCDASFRQAPASCEATSFCKQGCCYNSVEGTCSEKTPEKVCADSKGVWADNANCDIPQCQKGCCVLGKQASFVSLTRCKKLSSSFGLQTDFRPSVATEADCIAIAENEDEGACVFEVDFVKTCRFTTRANCKNPTITDGKITSNATFHEDFLCSAEELATNCAPSRKTTCVAGKDEVYFVDTCNNPANIYEASKFADKLYWKKVVPKSSACPVGTNPANCGNCDYIAGSICSAFDRKRDKTAPTFGDNICRNLNCKSTIDGNSYRHGESWCIYDSTTGNGEDPVGSRQWKHICYAGEELVEPCADFRNEQCIEDSIPTAQGDFSQAACRVNRWQDCASQEEQNDCENTDKRDCRWIETENAKYLTTFGNTTTTGVKRIGVCLPNVKPGIQFWTPGDSEGVCALGNAQCIVKYEKKLFEGGKGKVEENEQCLNVAWNQSLTDLCSQISDCTGSVSVASSIRQNPVGFSPGATSAFGGATGRVISELETASSFLDFIKKLFGGEGEQVFLEPPEDKFDFDKDANLGLRKESNSFFYTTNAGEKDVTILFKKLIEHGAEVNKRRIGSDSYNQVVVTLPNGKDYSIVTKDGKETLMATPSKVLNTEDISKLSDNNFFEPESLIFQSFVTSKGLTTGQPVEYNNERYIIKSLGVDNVLLQSTSNPTQTTSVNYNSVMNIVPRTTSPLVGKEIFGLYTIKDTAFSIWAGNALRGLQWAGIVAGIVQLGGRAFGVDENAVNALTAALGTGIEAGFLLNGLIGKGGKFAFAKGGLVSGIIGAGVAFAVFYAMYRKETTETKTFQCKPFTPAIGGANCELCNNDKFRPCSEYRCRSLGQACQLLNSGTGNETCTWVNPRDVESPTITPFAEVLTKDHKYTDVKIRPPGLGMKIVSTERTDGCLKAFTPLQFGISTNEPTQCKIDFNHTRKFDDMAFFFGETNIFLYNHTQTMKLPSRESIEAESPAVPSDGTFTLYSRCKDANGNVNEDEFAIRFCVEQEPDTTPPQVEATSIINNQFVQFNLNDTEAEFYINEPSECRWSRQDKDFKLMENQMQCSSFGSEVNNNLVFTCRTTLFGLENKKDNNFFVRCKDKPLSAEKDRNIMSESFPFTLRGSQPLNIIDIKPNGTLRAFSAIAPVELSVETANGASNGDATCSFSQTGNENDFVPFFVTGSNKHSQTLNLAQGTYNLTIRCIDLGGNADTKSTTFVLEVDQQAPRIARFYNEKGVSLCGVEGCLKLVTDEKSTCAYSNSNCNFNIADGTDMPFQNSTEHFTDWKTDKTFYIRCRDTSSNEPTPRSCTAIIKPRED